MNVLIQSASRFVEANSCHSLIHCNLRSIHKNMDHFCTLLSSHPFVFNYIAVSETWLKQDETYSIPGYNFFSTTRHTSNRGGGVALFVKSDIPCILLSDYSKSYSSGLELIVAKCKNEVILVVYRAPNQKLSAFMYHFERLLEHVNALNQKTVICGDFNIDTLKDCHSDYYHMMSSYGFHNVISAPTRVTPTSSSCIDHILCNFDTEGSWCAIYDATISDHSPTVILFPVTEVQHIGALMVALSFLLFGNVCRALNSFVH